jgi:hypothetical protein
MEAWSDPNVPTKKTSGCFFKRKKMKSGGFLETKPESWWFYASISNASNRNSAERKLEQCGESNWPARAGRGTLVS